MIFYFLKIIEKIPNNSWYSNLFVLTIFKFIEENMFFPIDCNTKFPMESIKIVP